MFGNSSCSYFAVNTLTMTINLQIFFLLDFAKNEIRKPITASFICQERYKLYTTLNVTDISSEYHILPKSAYVLTCAPTYTNLFCLKANDTEWTQDSCRVKNGVFKCPLFHEFQTYFDFFKWKLSTIVVKMRVVYDTYHKTFTTVSKSVSPLFRCPNIRSIQEDDKMFNEPK